jgi:hypothetical protein
LIVDTGILYALVDRADRYHRDANAVFRSREHRIVPEPVIVETDWLVLEYLGVDAELKFLEGVARGEWMVIHSPVRADRQRAAALAKQYRDLELGYVDAMVMALAERLGETRIATTDRRHFLAVRPSHADAFELVP